MLRRGAYACWHSPDDGVRHIECSFFVTSMEPDSGSVRTYDLADGLAYVGDESSVAKQRRHFTAGGDLLSGFHPQHRIGLAEAEECMRLLHARGRECAVFITA